ncbi:MAG TPA: signal peptide peptidase SppA [Planctomycetes bacterium]|nr:signal peptide peptidase SppA [Planctomycetota bacterium]
MRRVCALLIGGTICAAANGCLVFVNLDLTTGKTPYEETVLTPAKSWWTDAKIALIDLHGVISKRYGSSGLLSGGPGPDPVSDMREALGRAAGDDDVKAVVLRIDSPGGYVAWCDMLHREVLRFRKETGKPVVACITNLGASGGYYVACGADRIHAAPGAAVGSIGVIALFLNLEKLAGKIGVETQVIKSADKKDMGGLWRALTDDERKVMQSMIDEYYGRFLDIVLAARPGLTRERLLPLADGRIVTAGRAAEGGLIDRVAYLDESIAEARQMAGLDDAALVTYRRGGEYKNNMYSQAPQAPVTNIFNVDLGEAFGAHEPGFYYLWAPNR